MRQTLRDKYESPDTQRVTVILEGGVCAASGEEEKNTEIDTGDGHESGGTIDVSGSEWE